MDDEALTLMTSRDAGNLEHQIRRRRPEASGTNGEKHVLAKTPSNQKFSSVDL